MYGLECRVYSPRRIQSSSESAHWSEREWQRSL